MIEWAKLTIDHELSSNNQVLVGAGTYHRLKQLPRNYPFGAVAAIRLIFS